MEAVIATAVASLLGMAMIVALTFGRHSAAGLDVSVTVQQQARRAFDLMSREVAKAGNVTQGTSSTTGVTFTGATRVNFQVAQSYDSTNCSSTGNICWGDGTTTGNWVHYVVSSNTLYRCTDTAAGSAISSYTGCTTLGADVNTFTIDYSTSTKIVTLKLAIQHSSNQVGGGSMSAGTSGTPLHEQIKLRNYNS